jgi:nucleoside-triphosphatase THEP1
MHRNIYLLTGLKQTGKTSTLLQVLQSNTYNAKGILTPVVNGTRHVYDIANDFYINIETTHADNYHIGRFSFDKTVIDTYANKLVQWSVQQTTRCIIIDEIGPLELNKKAGFYEALITILQQTIVAHTLLVVRPGLLHKIIALCKAYSVDWQVLHKHDILPLIRNIC